MRHAMSRGKQLIAMIVALIGLTGSVVLQAYSRTLISKPTSANSAEYRSVSVRAAARMPAGPQLEMRAADGAAEARAMEAYARLPLSFEANAGQTDPSVKFISRAEGHTLFLASTGAMLALAGEQQAVSMKLVGANPSAQAEGAAPLVAKTNYIPGNDARDWRTNVTNYSRVMFKNVYRGIDMVYYGDQRRLEYDFNLAPGANFRAIALEFDGAKGMRLDACGDLVLETEAGQVRQRKPVVYQEVNGVRKQLAGRYEIKGKRRAGFHVARYDRTKPLIIDPVLSYSTYFGTGSDEPLAIAVDAAGNAYVVGRSQNADFTTTAGAFQRTTGSIGKMFVAKLNASGTALIYCAFIGSKTGQPSPESSGENPRGYR